MKLIAHYILGDRFYCVDEIVRVESTDKNDKIAKCPVCFSQARHLPPSAHSLVQTESLDDYINRLYGE